MPTHDRTNHVTRAHIMNLLSDDEVGKVSTAETASALVEGDEYIALDDLDRGIRKADGRDVPMGTVVPRKAVRESTWVAILMQVASYRMVART